MSSDQKESELLKEYEINLEMWIRRTVTARTIRVHLAAPNSPNQTTWSLNHVQREPLPQ